MNIVYIANARFPNERAHGIQIAKMCEAFIQNGATIELVVPRTGGETSTRHIIAYYGLSVPADTLRVTGIPVFPRSRTSRLGFIISSLVFGFLSALYVRNKEGTLYSIDLDYFSFVFIPLLRRPFFFEIHSAKKNTLAHRFLFRHATSVIAINEHVKISLEKIFPALVGRVIVRGNGVDIGTYKKAAHKTLKHPAIVYTGSFQDWKGLDTVLKAAALLPKTTFYLIGGERSALSRLGSVPENVETPGPQSFINIPSFQAAADALLLSGTKKDAYSSRYTSPMKLFEYAATGKPIVAVRTAAVTSVLSSEDAFWYEPDNAGSLVETVRQALENPSEARRRAARAGKKALTHSWDERARAVISFLQKGEV